MKERRDRKPRRCARWWSVIADHKGKRQSFANHQRAEAAQAATYPMVMCPKPFDVVMSSCGHIGFMFDNGGGMFLDDEDTAFFCGLAFVQASMVIPV